MWILVFLIMFSYYYNFNHENNYQSNNLSVDIFPEYKNSIPLIYFLFIIQQ